MWYKNDPFTHNNYELWTKYKNTYWRALESDWQLADFGKKAKLKASGFCALPYVGGRGGGGVSVQSRVTKAQKYK